MLKISKEKLAHIISSAKEHDESAGHWDKVVDNSFNDTMTSPIADELTTPSGHASLLDMVDELNDVEKASLIALSMIGRGEVSPRDFDKAMTLALAEDTDRAATYLLRIPMVSEYLEEGLEKLSSARTVTRLAEMHKV